ncbi:MAG: hypothetical protein AB8G17_13620 [Gammaproteobacteria bacterium]
MRPRSPSAFWSPGPRDGSALAITLAISTALLAYYFDRFWLPRDDGYYLHIASRLLDGEVLNRDVQGLHLGLGYFADALALKLFGRELLSLHIPVFAAGVAQVVLAFFLLREKGLIVTVVAGAAMTAISVIQYYSPTPHWYCLPLVFGVILVLSRRQSNDQYALLALVGVLLSMLFQLRQLTGVFTAMGAFTYLFLSCACAQQDNRAIARGVIVIMLVGLIGYLMAKGDALTWLVFGAWPLALMLIAFKNASVSNATAVKMLLAISAGGVFATLPIVTYHLLNGSVSFWLHDTFVDAIALSEFDYQQIPRYATLIAQSIASTVSFGGVAKSLSAAYWLPLVLGASVLGIATVNYAAKTSQSRTRLEPLPIVACHYGLVALHYQVPAYLFFSGSVVLAGLLWFSDNLRPRQRALVLTAVAIHSTIGIALHAGQPITRSPSQVIAGERVPLVPSTHPALDGLHVTPRDNAIFNTSLRLIEQYSEPGDVILGLPAEAELYFLSGRKNPFRYSFVPFGIRDEKTVADALATLAANPPRLVFHVSVLPYNTPYTDRLMDFVRSRYELIERVEEYDIYVEKGSGLPSLE